MAGLLDFKTGILIILFIDILLITIWIFIFKSDLKKNINNRSISYYILIIILAIPFIAFLLWSFSTYGLEFDIDDYDEGLYIFLAIFSPFFIFALGVIGLVKSLVLK